MNHYLAAINRVPMPSVFRYNDFLLYNGKSVKAELLTRPSKNLARHVQVVPAHLARGLHPHRPPHHRSCAAAPKARPL
jgi:hypothetical protein